METHPTHGIGVSYGFEGHSCSSRVQVKGPTSVGCHYMGRGPSTPLVEYISSRLVDLGH